MMQGVWKAKYGGPHGTEYIQVSMVGEATPPPPGCPVTWERLEGFKACDALARLLLHHCLSSSDADTLFHVRRSPATPMCQQVWCTARQKRKHRHAGVLTPVLRAGQHTFVIPCRGAVLGRCDRRELQDSIDGPIGCALAGHLL
jgi:hypothetical protein